MRHAFYRAVVIRQDVAYTGCSLRKSTRRWYQSFEPSRNNRINLDTTIFEEIFRLQMVDKERINGREEIYVEEKMLLWNIMHEGEEEIDEVTQMIN